MNLKDVKAITIPECIVANNSQTFSSTTKTSSNAWFNYYPTSTSALGLCKAIRIKGKFHVYGNSYSWLGVWYNSDAQGGESQVTLNTGSGWVETPFDITCYLIRDDWINNTLWNVFAFGGGSSNYRWIRAVVAKTNNNNLDFYTQSDTTNEYFRVTVDSIEIGVKKITDSNNVVLWDESGAGPVTISYRKSVYQGTLPASKEVPSGYVLTADDLPTQTDSSAWSVTGWTIDGTTPISAGYVVNSNIELCAIHRLNVTSSNLFKRDYDDGTVSSSYGKTCTATASCGNVGNAATSGSTKTVAMTKKYSKKWSETGTFNSYYCGVTLGAWGGLVSTIQVDHACRMEWTPSRSTVSFTLPSGYTNEYNYTGCYPGYVCRNNSTGAYITAYNQNNTNKITYDVSEPSGGTTNALYIQYGKVTGSTINNLAWRGGYYYTGSSRPSSKSMTCNTSTTTETIYLYTTPTN